jgi:hypothetical protein
MKRTLFLAFAIAVGMMAWPDDAKAQGFGRVYVAPSYGGWSVGYGYTPGFAYQPQIYSGYWGWNRGHYDYQPGHFHRYGYVPPHVDYHHRGHYHAVNPYTGAISPFPHRHRHR